MKQELSLVKKGMGKMTYFSRLKMEEIEDKTLASYASHSSQSRGRLYPDNEPDYRMIYQRDRDRIIHTTAFRRLEYKTQVFINDEGDYYRTRLTHTLEVSQIGRTIARALGANEDLTESICLAHDLGHPPFGHSGERTLNKLMMEHEGFDHNKQSFNIVTELEHRYPEFPGLNLTWEVLEGIVKHETEYDQSDAKDFNPDLRGHIEAQIVNIADQLAYTAHDLDDGLRSNLISPRQLEGIEVWEILLDQTKSNPNQLKELDRHIIIRELIGLEVTDLIESTTKKIHASGAKTCADVQKLPYNVVGFSEDLHRRNRQLIDFLFQELYNHYRVVRMAKKADKIITDLFMAYVEEPAVLPDHIQSIIETRGLERTICDYIAGMTDRFSVEEHHKLFEPGRLP
jgi:dGTPase